MTWNISIGAVLAVELSKYTITKGCGMLLFADLLNVYGIAEKYDKECLEQFVCQEKQQFSEKTNWPHRSMNMLVVHQIKKIIGTIIFSIVSKNNDL